MLNQNKVAIISSGNGGQGLAAYFSNLGYETTLYAREQERVDMFSSNVFAVSGIYEKLVPVSLISCHMAEVVADAHLIMVTTPSQYHHTVAGEMAPYLEDGQIMVLNPGRTFGTYAFDQKLRELGCQKDVIIAEAETFIFTCRCLAVGQPRIYTIKNHVGVAAHNPKDTQHVVEVLNRSFPTFVPSPSTLHTGFGNLGMIFHPLPILMNLTRVENKEDFLYYRGAISPLVAHQLEKLDKERCAVAQRLIGGTLSAVEWLHEKYSSKGESIYECLQHTDAYAEVMTPKDLYTRYVFEDIPTGCVPMLSMGRYLGVDMPFTNALVQWASAVYGVDFYESGRNETKLDMAAICRQAEAMLA